MRALVTGGAGFIGSAIARALLDRGDGVRIIDNFFSGFRDNVPEGAELIEGDIRDLDTVEKACLDVEVVFHQAAVRSVPRSVDQPLLSHEANATGTLNVLVGAERAGVRRVVYASSSSAYGEGASRIQRESQKPNPCSPYAVSKLTGEQYCQVWTRVKGLSTVSLRYFNVFGPGQHPDSKYAAVFPAFIRALVDGSVPRVHWDGEQSRDFSYIDDVVRANLASASAGEDASGHVINIAGGQPHTVNDVLRSVSHALGTWVDPEFTPKRQGDIRATHAEISKAKAVLGWEPQAAWELAVRRTVEWFVGRSPLVNR